jgi:hypothetical protein
VWAYSFINSVWIEIIGMMISYRRDCLSLVCMVIGLYVHWSVCSCDVKTHDICRLWMNLKSNSTL